MIQQNIKTLGELKSAGYQSKSIKQELRENLISALNEGINVFQGIIGYNETVIPDLERAILSQHNINLLGLRGQAKTRLARLMTHLLDEFIPVIQGSEVNDDPFNPISYFGKELLKEKGDNLPIEWLHRTKRYAEKLATPDVTVADLIGDIDPIKAANQKLSYSDERVMHYGMIPRANRCIFVINELPDLQARIQVALFNILQEGDIQIRGFNVRMPLDIQMVFTANPEDYTNRGSIVTPLKDRIGSQILTHYPKDLETAKQITAQEAKDEVRESQIHIPEEAKTLIEQVGFEARNSIYVQSESGVSARMSITAMQNLMSAAELRRIKNKENKTTIRLSDFLGILPALTGKMELVYEGEQIGAKEVGLRILSNAVKIRFETWFDKVQKLKKEEETTPYDKIVEWFFDNKVELLDSFNDTEYKQQLDAVKPLEDLLEEFKIELPKGGSYFMKELLLWGLSESKVLKRTRTISSTEYTDTFGNIPDGYRDV